MSESEKRVKPYWIDFYGEYKHKSHKCDKLGKTCWRPVEGGPLVAEVKKMGKSPFTKKECPECW